MGCMFSGKSTELIRRVHRFQSIGKRVCVINHTTDTRTDDAVQTHYGEKVSALKYVHLMNFIEVGHALTYDVICIDDVFRGLVFFGDYVGRYIRVARDCGWGLSGDFQRNHFGEMHLLIPFLRRKKSGLKKWAIM